MPSIRELRRHLDAAGVDHSAARDRGALEELCVSRGLARREPAPSQPCAACREQPGSRLAVAVFGMARARERGLV